MPVLKFKPTMSCLADYWLQGKKKKKRENKSDFRKKFYLHFTDIYIDMFLFARMFWETESFKYSYIFLVLELVTQLTTTWKRLESIRGRNKSIPQDRRIGLGVCKKIIPTCAFEK